MDHPKTLPLFRRQLVAGAAIALAFFLITSVAVPTAAYASPETAAIVQAELEAKRATSTAFSVKLAQDAINALAEVDPEDGMAEGAAQMDVNFALSRLVSTTPLVNAISAAESRLVGDFAGGTRSWAEQTLDEAQAWMALAANPAIEVEAYVIVDQANYVAAALDNLVDLNGLRTAVSSASALDSSSYTAHSFASLTVAMGEARAALDNYNVTGSEVDWWHSNLDGAVAGMVNTAALAGKYGEADGLVEGDYLAAGWPAFYNAREVADSVLNDAVDFGKAVTVADVTAALEDLASTMDALEGLDGLIASAEAELVLAEAALNNAGTDYTAHSVARLQAAADRLADAIGNPVEAELNAGSSASAAARTSLVNASSFNNTYNLGVGYKEADFTAASWVPLAAWLATAQPIHDAISDPTVAVSQATLDASANAGWALMVKLVETRSLAGLRRVVDTYTGQVLTGHSAARLAAALDGADELLARATDSSNVITYAEVYVAIDALHNAYFGLVYTTDAVLRLNNYAGWFDPSNFTASSATALTSALTALNGLAYGDATTTVTAAQLADAVAAVDVAGVGLVSIEWLRNTLRSIDLSEFEADFSASSFGPFAAAVAAARAFLARATDPLVTITGAEVDSVTDSLFATSMDLVYVADLNDAVATNAGLVQSKYTAPSWAVFAAALADAQAIAARANDGATAAPAGQAEANLAAQALIAAAAALVVAPAPVENLKTGAPSNVTAVSLPRTGGSDLLVPAGGALALMLAGAGLMAVRRRSQVTDS